VIRRILRAVVIGAATVFASKLPGQHWSTPPTAVVVAPDRGGAPGGQGGPDDDAEAGGHRDRPLPPD
jgi:hypothetical protein